MSEPKISVITPVYKVEPYLRRCLDSIVNQTYHNLEIILVDDGSPDNCGSICDEYKTRDRRIIVVHKENGGVSSARNVGLDTATGEWIGWVDPDDWVEPDMFCCLIDAVQRYEADIAVCSRYEHYRDKNRFRGWEREEVFNTEEALGLLLKNDVMQNYLWDKLWRRSLFEGISFPVGMTFEDIAVMHRLFEKARRIICLPAGEYHYNLHTDSIVGDTSLENRINLYKVSMARLRDMEKHWPQFYGYLTGQCVVSAIGLWCDFLQNDKNKRRMYLPELKEIARFSKAHYRYALQNIVLGPTGKMAVLTTRYATWFSFTCAHACSWIYELKHGRKL